MWSTNGFVESNSIDELSRQPSLLLMIVEERMPTNFRLEKETRTAGSISPFAYWTETTDN